MNRFHVIFVRPVKAVASFWLVRFTLAGKLVVAGCLLAVLSTVGIQVPTDQLVAALAVLLAFSLVAGFIFCPRLRVTGTFPKKATSGHQLLGHFTVTNRSRFPAFDVELDLFHLPELLRHATRDRSIRVLGPGETSRMTITLSLQRRGLFHLRDALAYSAFPFQLIRFGRNRQKLESLLVLPAFNPLTSLNLPTGSRYQPGGVAMSSRVGESPEYIGSREYLPGDPMRKMDHRAWARLGVPAVREFQEEYYCRVGIVLDTYVPGRSRTRLHGALEAGVSLTAAVAETLSRGETLINVFASGPELYVFEAGRHTAHLENVLEILACVEPCRSRPYDRLGPAITEQLQSISATVCVFLDWDESRRQLARAVIESGSHLKLLFVIDGETSEPFDEPDLHDVAFLTPDSILQGKVDEL